MMGLNSITMTEKPLQSLQFELVTITMLCRHMRSAFVPFSSSVGFAILGFALPLAFPKVDRAIIHGLLGLASFLLIAAGIIWLWGRKQDVGDSPAQGAAGNNNFAGSVQGSVHVGDVHHYGSADEGVWPAFEAGMRHRRKMVAAETEHAHTPQSESRPWYEDRTRFTIIEIACLAVGIAPKAFGKSDKAQSLANELRYFVYRGLVPIAGAPESNQVARRLATKMNVPVSEVSLETYISKSDIDLFTNPSLRIWLDVQDDSWRKHRG